MDLFGKINLCLNGFLITIYVYVHSETWQNFLLVSRTHPVLKLLANLRLAVWSRKPPPQIKLSFEQKMCYIFRAEGK